MYECIYIHILSIGHSCDGFEDGDIEHASLTGPSTKTQSLLDRLAKLGEGEVVAMGYGVGDEPHSLEKVFAVALDR